MDRWVLRGPLLLPEAHVRAEQSLYRQGYRRWVAWRDLGRIKLSLERLQQVASQLSTDSVLLAVSALGIMVYHRSPEEQKLKNQLSAVKLFLSPETWQSITRLFESRRYQVVFHEEELLIAARLALTHGRPAGGMAWDVDRGTELLLGINDVLSFERELPTRVPLAVSLRRLGLFQGEATRYSLGRYYDLLVKRARSLQGLAGAIDLDGEFMDETGLTMEQFLAAGLLFHLPFSSKPPPDVPLHLAFIDTIDRFVAAGANATAVMRAMPLYVGDREWYARSFGDLDDADKPERSSFLPFQERPLYRLENGSTIPISMAYLSERMVQGIYWILHERWRRQDPRDGVSRLRTFLGHLFQGYISDLLTRVYRSGPQPETMLWTESDLPRYGPKKQRRDPPDILVVQGRDLLVFEVNVATVPAAVRTGADVERFAQTTIREFRRKLAQVNSYATDVLEGKLAVPGLALCEVRRIFPLLVLLSPFPQTPAIFAHLGQGNAPRPQSVSTGHGRVEIYPPQLITAEELEILEPIMSAGQMRLGDLFVRKLADHDAAYQSVKNFLYLQPGFRETDNTAMQRLYQKVTDVSLRTLRFTDD